MRYRLSQRHLNSGNRPIKKLNRLHHAEEAMEFHPRKSQSRKCREIGLSAFTTRVMAVIVDGADLTFVGQ